MPLPWYWAKMNFYICSFYRLSQGHEEKARGWAVDEPAAMGSSSAQQCCMAEGPVCPLTCHQPAWLHCQDDPAVLQIRTDMHSFHGKRGSPQDSHLTLLGCNGWTFSLPSVISALPLVCHKTREAFNKGSLN